MSTDFLSLLEEKKNDFSKGHRSICDYVLKNYDKAAYMTASKLAKEVGVSESTVVRFASELGFDGYPEFQKEIKLIIRNKLTSVQRIDMNLSNMTDMPADVLQSDIDNIKSTLESIDKKRFNDSVDRILNAKRIYIIGVRSCSGLASFLAYYFDMLFDNVKLLHTTSGSEIFEQLFSLGKDDLLIAISYPRYSKRIVDAVRFARSKEAGVIAITDSANAPISEYASDLLIAKTDVSSFVDSLVSPLSIINALIVALGRKKRNELVDRLERLEEIWDEYDVYQKTPQ